MITIVHIKNQNFVSSGSYSKLIQVKMKSNTYFTNQNVLIPPIKLLICY